MRDKIKPKVLIFCTRLLEAGGIESHVQSFVNELANDLDIYLVVLDSRLNKAQKENYRNKCKKIWIIKKGVFIERLIFLFIALIQVRKIRFDYFYSNGQGDSISLTKKMLRNKAIWVHHHHTAVSKKLLSEWSSEYSYTLKNATVLNACSKSIADELEAITLRKSLCVPCFSYPIKTSKTFNINSPIKLGFFGRLIPEKGITQLCRISKVLDPSLVEIHIWGKGELYDANFFENYPNVNFHGSFEGKDELSVVLNLIDAFILISEHPEGLPISLLEVMGAGKPWIATNIGGIRDIVIEKDRNYLLPQNLSEEDLVTHINNFIEGLINRPNISELQIEKYDERYSPKKVSEDWLKIFSLK